MQSGTEPRHNSSWTKYMGMGIQFFASILLALWVGSMADDYFHFSGALLIWILPLLAVLFNLIRIVIDTQKKKQ